MRAFAWNISSSLRSMTSIACRCIATAASRSPRWAITCRLARRQTPPSRRRPDATARGDRRRRGGLVQRPSRRRKIDWNPARVATSRRWPPSSSCSTDHAVSASASARSPRSSASVAVTKARAFSSSVPQLLRLGKRVGHRPVGLLEAAEQPQQPRLPGQDALAHDRRRRPPLQRLCRGLGHSSPLSTPERASQPVGHRVALPPLVPHLAGVRLGPPHPSSMRPQCPSSW